MALTEITSWQGRTTVILDQASVTNLQAVEFRIMDDLGAMSKAGRTPSGVQGQGMSQPALSTSDDWVLAAWRALLRAVVEQCHEDLRALHPLGCISRAEEMEAKRSARQFLDWLESERAKGASTGYDCAERTVEAELADEGKD